MNAKKARAEKRDAILKTLSLLHINRVGTEKSTNRLFFKLRNKVEPWIPDTAIAAMTAVEVTRFVSPWRQRVLLELVGQKLMRQTSSNDEAIRVDKIINEAIS